MSMVCGELVFKTHFPREDKGTDLITCLALDFINTCPFYICVYDVYTLLCVWWRAVVSRALKMYIYN